MTVITTLRAANDNVSPSSLLAVAKWNEREASRYNRIGKARLLSQAAELRKVASQMKEVA